MIADINMSFYFIGGQGLKEPVARLQNALSFNYFANTEVYDDRSDVTEERSKINAIVWEGIQDFTPFGINSTANPAQPNDFENTIGDILSTNIVSEPIETLSGVISYDKIMNDFVETATDYFETTFNALENINDSYFYGGLVLFTDKRKYIQGYVDPDIVTTINLFGKPELINNNIDDLFKKLITDNENETSPFYVGIKLKNFKNSEIKKYKRNLKLFINKKRIEYDQFYVKNLKVMVDVQQRLIRLIDKLNFVQLNSDGYRLKTNENILFSITGITENNNTRSTFDDLKKDIKEIGEKLNNFYRVLNEDQIIPNDKGESITFTKYDFNTFNNNISTPEQKRLFVGLGKNIFSDEINSLIDEILGDELKDDEKWKGYLKNIIEKLKENYLSSYKSSKDKFNKFKQFEINSFIKFSLSEPEKTRNFNYKKLINNPLFEEEIFNQLYLGRNTGEDNFFNFKIKLD